MPKTRGDEYWTSVVDKFWAVMRAHFELRQDTSCGLHVHISMLLGKYDLPQLRKLAKAVIYWDSAVIMCAPPSRSARVSSFCGDNLQSSDAWDDYMGQGPLRGLKAAFEHIDTMDRDSIVAYVCPNGRRGWNFKPALATGSGSVEFRRPPGVVTAKKAKHWIAFVMCFVDMAMKYNPHDFMIKKPLIPNIISLILPEFESQLLASAKALGLDMVLDARLHQKDDPRSLYLHPTLRRNSAAMEYLQKIDQDYGCLSEP